MIRKMDRQKEIERSLNETQTQVIGFFPHSQTRAMVFPFWLKDKSLSLKYEPKVENERERAPSPMRRTFQSLLRHPKQRRMSIFAAQHQKKKEELYDLLLDAKVNASYAQRRAVDAAIVGYSVFLHLPTGAGKSLAFQVPALLSPHPKITLVVSPLIALMNVSFPISQRTSLAY